MNSRQLVLFALKDLDSGSYADVVVDRLLTKFLLSDVDRHLFTELVNGIVRRRRTLDAIIDRLAKQPATRQPPQLRHLLQLGLYQLRYLDRIPESAAVNTTVDLAKTNGLAGLAGVVNGILRQYLRLQGDNSEVLNLPSDLVERLGVLYSFPDWLIAQWLTELGEIETEQLCQAFNRSPSIDLRLNILTIPPDLLPTAPLTHRIEQHRTNLIALFQAAGVTAIPIPDLPQGLRFSGNVGAISQLPGYREGWWTIQDSSAQLVTHLLPIWQN
jgi:16S rRNA (cytosine967-C5)-methyltransferase